MAGTPVIDPFEGYSMQELVELDEKSFRSYQVHKNVKFATNQKDMCKDLKDIKIQLSKRPEVVRANIAIVSTIITVIIAAAALIVAITGG